MTSPRTRQPLTSNRKLGIVTLLLALLAAGIGLRASAGPVPRVSGAAPGGGRGCALGRPRLGDRRDVLARSRKRDRRLRPRRRRAPGPRSDHGRAPPQAAHRGRARCRLCRASRGLPRRSLSAPDDAGLSDRCWGEPDLGALVAAALAIDGAGHPALRAGRSIVVDAPLRRGQVRCDYPPGELAPQEDRRQPADRWFSGRRHGPPDLIVRLVSTNDRIAAPPDRSDRLCGLATVVYLEQGEPRVSPPSVSGPLPRSTP